MDKLTFLDNGEPAYKLGNCVYKNEISQRLYAYERTGITPAEIERLKAHRNQSSELFINYLHSLLDIRDKQVAALNGTCKILNNLLINFIGEESKDESR